MQKHRRFLCVFASFNFFFWPEPSFRFYIDLVIKQRTPPIQRMVHQNCFKDGNILIQFRISQDFYSSAGIFKFNSTRYSSENAAYGFVSDDIPIGKMINKADCLISFFNT